MKQLDHELVFIAVACSLCVPLRNIKLTTLLDEAVIGRGGRAEIAVDLAKAFHVRPFNECEIERWTRVADVIDTLQARVPA